MKGLFLTPRHSTRESHHQFDSEFGAFINTNYNTNIYAHGRLCSNELEIFYQERFLRSFMGGINLLIHISLLFRGMNKFKIFMIITARLKLLRLTGVLKRTADLCV